jgi:hypothetical protein
MNWTLLDPLLDVEDVTALARVHFESEVDEVLRIEPYWFRQNLTVCSTYQLFDRSREFLAVCRDGGKLLGYCWFDRSGYTTYSREEISNAKFHHVDMSLSARVRVRLINEMIDQHILWADKYNIPVICSTSIRGEHEGFMKIHKKRGFQVNGSYAWIRTADGIKRMTNV